MALSDGVRLELVEDLQHLQRVDSLSTLREATPAPGAWVETATTEIVAAPTSLAEDADALGAPLPDWTTAPRTRVFGPTVVCRAADVHVAPGYGAVIADGGRVMRATVAEMLSWRDDLSLLAHVETGADGAVFTPPHDLPARGPVTVWRPWGGDFNYGHYLLDCLPALLAVEEAGLLERAPPICGRLKPWSRDLLALAFPSLQVEETDTPLLRAEAAVYAQAVDHFLHRPNPLLARLRARILANSPPPGRRGRRVYLSRRGHPMRVMVNEAELERALRARDFHIVRAERLAIAAQIALMRGAELVVGPTGAGLANALFTEPGARIVEIQPETFTAPWLDMLCAVIGRRWTGYFCPAPVDPREVSLAYRIRRGFGFGYRLPLAPFLDFIDTVIAGRA